MEKWLYYDSSRLFKFYFNRKTEVTDGLLTPEDLEKIQFNINEITFAHWVGDGMPYASDEPDIQKLTKFSIT